MATIEVEPGVLAELVEAALQEGITPGVMLERLLDMHIQQRALAAYERLLADDAGWKSYLAERKQFEYAALTDLHARIDND